MHNVTYYINSNDYVYTETSHVSDYYQNNMQTTIEIRFRNCSAYIMHTIPYYCLSLYI